MTTPRTHRCAAPGCARRVPLSRLMCPTHWYRVPAALRREIRDTWDAGDRTGHRMAVVRAIRALRREEAKAT